MSNALSNTLARPIGVHLRVMTTLLDVLQRAQALQVPVFQCFLSDQATGFLIHPEPAMVREFLAYKRAHFTTMYAHGSYKTNLCNTIANRSWLLKKELALAKAFEFTHLILHPGSARGAIEKRTGIQALARTLNRVLRTERDIKIVLENVAHGGMSIGGDLQDFADLLALLDHPEKIAFCIDTAHAYSYGYDLVNNLEDFVQTIEQTVGTQRVALLHINDTVEQCGGRIDKHQDIGKGLLGTTVLRVFAMHPLLAHIPIIIEPPLHGGELDSLKIVREF